MDERKCNVKTILANGWGMENDWDIFICTRIYVDTIYFNMVPKLKIISEEILSYARGLIEAMISFRCTYRYSIPESIVYTAFTDIIHKEIV